MPMINYATRWFYRHIAHSEVEPGAQVCAMCGLPMASGRRKTMVLRPTFVDWDLQAAPTAHELCPACVWYFDHQELLRASWYLSATRASQLTRAELRALLCAHLACPPAEDRYYLVALTKKKHVALRAGLNASGSRLLRVTVETLVVEIDERFPGLLDDLEALRRHHGWAEIENDAYASQAVRTWPELTEFMACRQRVRPWLRTQQFVLARYLCAPTAVHEEGTDGRTQLLA